MTADWATLEQPDLKERALAAYEKRMNDRRNEWDDQLHDLWADSITFFRQDLLFSEDEIQRFLDEAIESHFEPSKKNGRPYILWTFETIKFKLYYVSEEVAVIEVNSGTKKERINDYFLYVMVDNGRGGYKRIQSLADLGEFISK